MKALRIPICIIAGLYACAIVPSPDAPLSDASACEAACAHRSDVGCLDADLREACVPACVRSSSLGWYDAAAVARAPREGMRALGVRCHP